MDEPTSENRFTEKVRPWASAAVLVSVAALGFGIAQSLASFADSVRVELNNSARCCESFRAYSAEDAAQRRFWIDIIRELQEADREQDHEIAHLQSAIAVIQAKNSQHQQSIDRDAAKRYEQQN